MQNKPNPQNTKSNLTLYPKKHYAKTSSLRPQKNKPKTNPIPNIPSAPRPALAPQISKLPISIGNQLSIIDNQSYPRPHKSAFCLLPPIKTPIPTTSGFCNFPLCLLPFNFSLLTLSPESAQFSPAANQLGAKTSKNYHSFAQNKPNPKKPKTSLTPYPKKNYADFPLPGPQKNKPNSNPIKPNSTARIEKTNPIQTQSRPSLNSPPFPINHTDYPVRWKKSKLSNAKPMAFMTNRPSQPDKITNFFAELLIIMPL